MGIVTQELLASGADIRVFVALHIARHEALLDLLP
jgi:hypothetical protein